MTSDQAITRQAEQSNAAAGLEQALAQQPQLTPALDKLGDGNLGDVRVEFYGKVHHFGKRIEVDLEDIALAGTTVSLSTTVTMKRWLEIERDLEAAIERSL